MNNGKSFFLSVFLMLLSVCVCKGQTKVLLYDEEQSQVCVKDGNARPYCFQMIEFSGYDNPPQIRLKDKKISMHFGSSSFASYINTEWEFNEASGHLILKNMIGIFPDHFDYDNRVNVCSMSSINVLIDDIDAEYLLEKLTNEAEFCRYEYNNLPPLQEISERISTESRKDKYFLKSYGADINRYKSYLKAYPISRENCVTYNDIGYYLEQAGNYEESAYLLEKIITEFPDRVVAHLNIADAYWGNNEKEEARKSYQKYIKLMQIQGKDMSKIPQRVYDRIK